MATLTFDEMIKQLESHHVDVVFSDKFIAVSLAGNVRDSLDLVYGTYLPSLCTVQQTLIVLSCAYGVSPGSSDLETITSTVKKIEQGLGVQNKSLCVVRAPDSMLPGLRQTKIKTFKTLPEALKSFTTPVDSKSELQQFQQAAEKVFEKQFDIFLKAQSVERVTVCETQTGDQVLGLIPLVSDSTAGNLILRFAVDTIETLGEKTFERKLKIPDMELLEVAGELANMILGVAKEELNRRGYGLQQVMPQMFCSSEYGRIELKTEVPFWRVKFDSSAGPFSLELALKSVV